MASGFHCNALINVDTRRMIPVVLVTSVQCPVTGGVGGGRDKWCKAATSGVPWGVVAGPVGTWGLV